VRTQAKNSSENIVAAAAAADWRAGGWAADAENYINNIDDDNTRI